MGVDDILEGGLRATRKCWDFELMWKLALWGSGVVKGSSFAKGHGGINGSES
jgi:hypothetical protein